MPPMLYVLIFLAAFLAAEGIALLLNEQLSGHRAAARRRLREIALGVQNPDVQSEDSILRARRRVGLSALDLARFMPGGFQLERRLYQAGLTASPGGFAMLCCALGIVAWIAVSGVTGNPIAALPFLLVGLVPVWYIGTLREQRMRRVEEEVPEALALITRAMR